MFHRHQSTPPQVVRTRCRNLRCGAKLQVPTDDRKVAFCCEACERTHFAFRCRVCEAALSRKTKRRNVCWRSHCRHELQRHPERYFGLRGLGCNTSKPGSATPLPGLGHNAQENPAKSTLKTGAKSGRAFRIVAGPDLHPVNLRIPPELPTPSRADRGFREYIRRESAKALFQRDTPPVNVIGGYRFPGAPQIDLSPPRTPQAPAGPMIGDGLDIPAFLRRTTQEESK